MKQDWEEIQLGDLCEFRNGLWKGKKPPFVTSKVIRMTNFTKECEMNTIEPIELEVEEKQYSSRSLIDGDLLLEKSGGGPKQPVGRVVRFEAPDNGNYSFSNFTTRIRISKLDKIDSKYLHKYLKFFYLIGRTEPLQSNSTNIRNLQLPAFKKILIPVPPLEEQKQIVAKLDQCFEAIDKAKANAAKNLENSKELFQSKLNDIFSQKGEDWVEKKLGDVCKLIDSLHKTPSYIKEGGFPMIRVTDIKDGFINFKNARRVNKDVYGEFSKRHIASIGDLVLSRVGSYGIPAIVETDTLFCLGQNTVFLIPLINTYWIYYFLISPNSKQQMDKSASGVAQPTVSLKSIKQINIPIPSLEEQKQIVKILDSLRKQTQSLESKYQQELNSLEELKKSILQKAFEGEL